MKRYDLILKFLQDQTEGDLIFIYNQNCDCDKSYTIYPMEAFDDMMNDKSYLDVIKAVQRCDYFDPDDDWFRFDFHGTGFFTSSDPCYDWIDIIELARDIDESNDSLGIPELEEILNMDEQKARKIVKAMEFIENLDAVSMWELFDKYNTRDSYKLAKCIVAELFE
ncbi:MAG: hypothetical protein IKU44_04460 [Firmicutes bacterium]|nr:hypothetical protein [Bacillota bacterium]